MTGKTKNVLKLPDRDSFCCICIHTYIRSLEIFDMVKYFRGDLNIFGTGAKIEIFKWRKETELN